MDKTQRFNVGYALIALALLLLFQAWLSHRSVAQISWTELESHLSAGDIAEVTITESFVEGRFTRLQDGSTHFITRRVDPYILEMFDQAGVPVTGASDENWLTTIVSWVLPIGLMFGLWYFMFRGMAGGGGIGGLTAIGKSRAKVYVETETGVSFADVAGVDEAKAELEEIVSFLKNRERYGRLGARIPKGILLVGPPGTGKTLMARAVAGEAGVPFFSISGSEFVEMFVGVGAARVRDLFEQARKAAPCIIFIDELDALGRARSAFTGLGGGDEKEQTLNQLLAELDGFDPRVGIVLLAATNRPEILDPALMRAGRFDRQVVLDRPDHKGRAAILSVHMKRVTLDPAVSAEDVAALTPGFTGADLANLVNEAAIQATRRDAEMVSLEDFTRAVERIVAGLEQRSRILRSSEKARVAVHEMGHALVAAELPSTDPVHKVSIIPRSVGALGYTMQRPTEDRFLLTRAELEDRMQVLLAGRAAEEIVYGDFSTGAADDLVRATDIARQIMTRFGMSDILGQAVLEQKRQIFLDTGLTPGAERDYSEKTAREIDVEIRDLITRCFAEARQILEARREDLDAGAALLLEVESISPADFPPIARRNVEERGAADQGQNWREMA